MIRGYQKLYDEAGFAGKKLRELRLSSGLLQSEFARRIGVAPSFVSAIEVGHVKISPKIMARIVKAFGVSEDYFKGE